MKIICKEDDCFGCLACVNVCPKKCINIAYDNHGFIIPSIDENICINCNRCINVCPANNLPQLNKPVDVLAGQIKIIENLKESTSGGIFQAIAMYILKENGIVCAAKKELDNNLHHVIIRNEFELQDCLKSKYYQSSTEDTFRCIKDALNNNLRALFCGTPCQVAGLISYLGRPYDNLITCDLVCHGVPSKKVIDSYLAEKEHLFGAKVSNILFRDKSRGWDKMRITINFDNGKVYSNIASYDDFYFGFFRGLYYRKSCYNCPFAKEERVADISLGDFWGIEYTKTKIDYTNGVSLILVNTEKGLKLIDALDDSILKEKYNLLEAKKFNHNLKGQSHMNHRYKLFYTLLDHHTFRYSLIKTLPFAYLKFSIKKLFRLFI